MWEGYTDITILLCSPRPGPHLSCFMDALAANKLQSFNLRSRLTAVVGAGGDLLEGAVVGVHDIGVHLEAVSHVSTHTSTAGQAVGGLVGGLPVGTVCVGSALGGVKVGGCIAGWGHCRAARKEVCGRQNSRW